MDIGAQDLLADDTEKSRGLVEDVVEALRGDEHGYGRTVAFAEEWHAGGGDLAGLARELSRLARQLEERLEERLGLAASDRRKVREVLDEAGAHALEAFGQATRGRRDRWLSYHAHEMRNALNTLVNAHWILRNGEGKNTTKVFDMAERAVRRLENAVKDVRELETQSQKPAPGRPDKT